ncbi:hypothetical protein F5883DRAFT_585360 [Diaporthe sp. PMI_573]|nr:hypothetical protein F5883DRAFT_585360 [Diaporthaceae sp. PMI_573]
MDERMHAPLNSILCESYCSCIFRDAKFPNLLPATIDFQLQQCGPFLERSFDPAPDPRVPFILKGCSFVWPVQSGLWKT